MFGRQHRVDERKRAEQVRVTQMKRRDREGCGSCAGEEERPNPVIKKETNFLTWPASLEMASNVRLSAENPTGTSHIAVSGPRPPDFECPLQELRATQKQDGQSQPKFGLRLCHSVTFP